MGKTGNLEILRNRTTKRKSSELDEFDSFAADMLAFSTEEVKRANLVSIRI